MGESGICICKKPRHSSQSEGDLDVLNCRWQSENCFVDAVAYWAFIAAAFRI